MNTKKKRLIGLTVVAVLALAGWGCYKYMNTSDGLKLYGAIDMRTVNLAFEESGRMQEMLVEEGSKVAPKDVIAKLDDRRYLIAYNNAQSALDTAQAELTLLSAGPRPQEVEVARAKVSAMKSQLALSTRTCHRERKLGEATSVMRRDQACSQMKVDQAQLQEAQKTLDLVLAGTRQEEIDVAKARVQQARTVLADAKRALENCTLRSPGEGVIRSRMKEPGDMVSANAPIVELALMNPLWARVYIDEVNLGKIAMGQSVKLTVDSYPEQVFEATVGFISTVAEFTPKTVQTEAIRTHLVYEVRLTVSDPNGLLRLGMPVTAQLQ